MSLKTVFAATLAVLALNSCKEREVPRHPVYRSSTTIYPPAKTVDGVSVKQTAVFNEKMIKQAVARVDKKQVDSVQIFEEPVIDSVKTVIDTVRPATDTLRVNIDSLSTRP